MAHRIATSERCSISLPEIYERMTIVDAIRMIDYLDALGEAEENYYEGLK